MKFRNLFMFLDSDEFVFISPLGDIECVRLYEKGGLKNLRKCADYTVERIVPFASYFEIYYS